MIGTLVQIAGLDGLHRIVGMSDDLIPVIFLNPVNEEAERTCDHGGSRTDRGGWFTCDGCGRPLPDITPDPRTAAKA